MNIQKLIITNLVAESWQISISYRNISPKWAADCLPCSNTRGQAIKQGFVRSLTREGSGGEEDSIAKYRRRIELEDKAKVVASDWRTESLPR